MDWFARLCRNAGLMIHHTIEPLRKTKTTRVSHSTEEHQPDERVTLRRTTIEEIEIHPPDAPEKRD